MNQRKIGSVIESVIPELNRPTTEYKRRKHGYKMPIPEVARFKGKFWYVDGNNSSHYSIELIETWGETAKKTVRNEEVGFFKLLQMFDKQHKRDRVRSFVIWASFQEVPRTRSKKMHYNLEVFKYTLEEGILRPYRLKYIRESEKYTRLDLDHLQQQIK